MERIVAAIKKGAKLKAIACEKPLGRNAAEAARMVELVEEAGVLHGYLENQLFMPSLERGKQIVWARGAASAGRPYLARAAEEHGGPHMPWFWQGDLQGGGVLNDMMCHSLEVGRYLLTKPGAPRDSIRPRQSVGADRVAQVVASGIRRRMLRGTMTDKVDYGKHPAEDWARATRDLRGRDGHAADCRSDDVVEFRRRRLAVVDGAARARVLDVGQHARRRHQGVLLAPAAGAAEPAKI